MEEKKNVNENYFLSGQAIAHSISLFLQLTLRILMGTATSKTAKFIQTSGQIPAHSKTQKVKTSQKLMVSMKFPIMVRITLLSDTFTNAFSLDTNSDTALYFHKNFSFPLDKVILGDYTK